MTGKELVLYIIGNNLLDQPIFKDGKLIGCQTIEDYAVENNIGIASAYTFLKLHKIPCLIVNEQVFVPMFWKKGDKIKNENK